MSTLFKKLRTLLAGRRSQPQRWQHGSAGPAADWLPPVLGPGDWSAGLLADRSANWYFDRS